MLQFPNLDPVIARLNIPRLGEIQLRLYSLIYVLGLGVTFFFFRRSIKKGTLSLTTDQAESVLISALLGMIVGARLLYTLVYNFSYFSANPAEIVQVWRGGLAFHGGLIGAWIAVLVYARQQKLDFFNIADHFSLILPVGLACGRIGNFLNGELWGTVTEAPWGMIFPGAGPLPRHPSQLYEAFFEGPVLFSLLLIIWQFRPRSGLITVFFLGLYGLLRFFCEFFREPDAQLGLVVGPFTLGQVFCLAMGIAAGVLATYIFNRRDRLQV